MSDRRRRSSDTFSRHERQQPQQPHADSHRSNPRYHDTDYGPSSYPIPESYTSTRPRSKSGRRHFFTTIFAAHNFLRDTLEKERNHIILLKKKKQIDFKTRLWGYFDRHEQVNQHIVDQCKTVDGRAGKDAELPDFVLEMALRKLNAIWEAPDAKLIEPVELDTTRYYIPNPALYLDIVALVIRERSDDDYDGRSCEDGENPLLHNGQICKYCTSEHRRVRKCFHASLPFLNKEDRPSSVAPSSGSTSSPTTEHADDDITWGKRPEKARRNIKDPPDGHREGPDSSDANDPRNINWTPSKPPEQPRQDPLRQGVPSYSTRSTSLGRSDVHVPRQWDQHSSDPAYSSSSDGWQNKGTTYVTGRPEQIIELPRPRAARSTEDQSTKRQYQKPQKSQSRQNPKRPKSPKSPKESKNSKNSKKPKKPKESMKSEVQSKKSKKSKRPERHRCVIV